ncbi:hypothetical protein PsYK624_169240 [Phanerochaete sordida]|uniref:Uncharacterized protein n=1 Tax=Phanerochaete sordida TaxID=48140 RepID=A0A9P3LNS8_9APHY|nr:hypothetical protein PsYK624_169240 [Phanerochaete sordida]
MSYLTRLWSTLKLVCDVPEPRTWCCPSDRGDTLWASWSRSLRRRLEFELARQGPTAGSLSSESLHG